MFTIKILTSNQWVDVSQPLGGFSGDYNDLENKPPLFGLQDGSLTKNLLTWRNEGEIDSWTADDRRTISYWS